MLPSLKKIGEKDGPLTQLRGSTAMRQQSVYEAKNTFHAESSRKQNRIKVGGGFKLSNEDINKIESAKAYDTYNSNPSKTLIYPSKKSTTDFSSQIKLIQKKIKQCQRKIQQQKRKKLQDQRKNQQDRYQHDFDRVIKRQMQLQNKQKTQQHKGFDYLTNPGGPPAEQPQEVMEQEHLQVQFNISDGVQKLERFYQNSLKKKFERRQMFPHKACRRKTPKLYITQKTNALSKHGKPQTQVMTKEITPQEIYPVIPGFAVVKDNLSKNIVAYLGDYKPFIEKTKQKVEKEAKKQEEQMLIQNSNKSVTILV